MISARARIPLKSSLPHTRAVVSSLRRWNFSSSAHDNADNRASSKLFEDAAREEAQEASTPVRPSRISILEGQSENWTGEESTRDAVLRMLVDKYKPLRSGPIRTADEKLKQAPPNVSAPNVVEAASAVPHPTDSVQASTPRKYLPHEPLLPSIEGHKPWHTTFKVPSHATSSIRYGHIPQPSRTASSLKIDDKAKRLERDAKRRTAEAGRLSRAKESTLDYRLGIKNGAAAMQARPAPATLKGWSNLVEDRIERARQAGLFNNVKGRGQPLASHTQDKNPFIGREEFLMNRIVQRQGAAPPWVEVQGELESAINSFRDVIRQSWTRRAIRMLTISQPAALLPRLTLSSVTSLRDAEWEARERAFHEKAIDEMNALVRKYNGLAPYAVRRAYYSRSAEVDKLYRDAAQDILHGLAARVNQQGMSNRVVDGEDEETAGSAPANVLATYGFREMIRDLWASLRGR